MRREAFHLQRLAVVGGGRWARVVIGVLHEIVPPKVRLSVYTPHNASAMRMWAADRYRRRIEVMDFMPDFGDRDAADAAIIANAVHDHLAAAKRAIGAGVPILVEKPLVLTEAEAREIVELAERHQVALACSRVPLFARHIQEFLRLVAGTDRIKIVRFTWSDARDETRHGEPKRYDPGLILFHDVLPHLLPVLHMLLGGAKAITSVALRDGGSRIELGIQAAGVPCVVSLARNAPSRRRIIEVETTKEAFALDFSEEPGQIFRDGKTQITDPLWARQPRPLSSMLQCFLAGLAEGRLDERFSARSAVAECRLADEVLPAYLQRQSEWLSARAGQPIDEGIRYALAEILARHDRKAPLDDDALTSIWVTMNAPGSTMLHDVLAATDRGSVVKMLLGGIS
jgi:predicted dehydrogenase